MAKQVTTSAYLFRSPTGERSFPQRRELSEPLTWLPVSLRRCSCNSIGMKQIFGFKLLILRIPHRSSAWRMRAVRASRRRRRWRPTSTLENQRSNSFACEAERQVQKDPFAFGGKREKRFKDSG